MLEANQASSDLINGYISPNKFFHFPYSSNYLFGLCKSRRVKAAPIQHCFAAIPFDRARSYGVILRNQPRNKINMGKE